MLTRKGLRDLWHMRTQALAIACVIAGGVATLVMSRSTLESL
jgi:putative ABC transport system permease protein